MPSEESENRSNQDGDLEKHRERIRDLIEEHRELLDALATDWSGNDNNER